MAGRPLFSINLELHDGTNEKIEFRENDVPEELAARFCNEKRLKKNIYNLIVMHLKDKLKDYVAVPKQTKSPAPQDMYQTATTADASQKRAMETKASRDDSNQKLTPNKHDSFNFSPLLKTRDLEFSSTKKLRDKSITQQLADSRSNVKRQTLSHANKKSAEDLTAPGIVGPPVSTCRGEFQFRTMQLITEDENGYYEAPFSIDNRWHTRQSNIMTSFDSRGNDALFLNPTFTMDERSDKNYYLGKKNQGRKGSHTKSKERGHQLYEKAIGQHLRRQMQTEQSESLKKECEMEGVTFAPSINMISTMIVEKKQQNSRPRYERLHEIASAKKLKLERCRELKKELENDQYDFKPQICELSKQLDKESSIKKTSLGESRFLQLYQDSKLRQSHTDILREQSKNRNCTFHPEINENSKKLIKSSKETGFKERLASSIEKMKENEKKHQERLSTPPVQPRPNISKSIKSNWVLDFDLERQISWCASVSIRYGIAAQPLYRADDQRGDRENQGREP